MIEVLAVLSLCAELHPELLFRTAATSLSSGRYADAFALADRYCRIRPLVSPNHLLLRAATRRAVDDPEGALEDIRQALGCDPVHLVANRSLMASGTREERLEATRILLARETEPSRQVGPIRVLAEGNDAVGVVRGGTEGVTGHFAWRGGPVLAVNVMQDLEAHPMLLQADVGHPLRDALGNASSWSLRWRDGIERLHIEVSGGIVVGSPTWNPGISNPPPSTSPKGAHGTRTLTVLVPVFGDHGATQTCLLSLLDEAAQTECHILVIDDATPDRAIAAMLDRLAGTGKIELLRNPYNRGFARSINHALQHTRGEDVVLLNADTILPRGTLSRLKHAAYSAPNIGTVTPLSNNGEYTSIPTGFRVNECPDYGMAQIIGDAADAANGAQIVDLPNGIGFCLYIRRDCLDDVGALSLAFGRGYYEDVEFCLRAAVRGWRNVCATGVYVGHAGARSFGSEKAILVKSGAGIVDRVHPGFEQASAAFVRADPLAGHRQAVERELLPLLGSYDLMVIPVTEGSDWRELLPPVGHAGGQRRLAALVDQGSDGMTISLRDPGGGFPQNLDLSQSDLADSLGRIPITSIDILDPMLLPGEVLDAVLRLGCPITVRIRDVGAMCKGDQISEGASKTCEVCGGRCPCDLELPYRVPAPDHRTPFEDVIAHATIIIVPDEDTRTLFSRSYPIANAVVPECSIPSYAPAPRNALRDRLRLGLIADSQGMDAALPIAIAEHFSRSPSPAGLIVFGSTSDDFHLMRSGPAFVTGPIQPHELGALFRNLGVARLLFPSRRRVPSDAVMRLCRADGIGVARFRWSTREPMIGRQGDLELPVGIPSEAVAELLLRWMMSNSIT
ncbi:glycosyltransferase [Microvirga massiliensis]|uniref:glycosyltransferase n=1 Tax=Microvirga massiliensis TaxID=1033741 RepID=UPI00062BDCC7|nr:glycosyltransferase [Microvirga massiliensis]